MAKQQKLTYSFYVGGVKVDKLTPEQKQKIGERFGEAVSQYYSRHPEEYLKLQEKEKCST